MATAPPREARAFCRACGNTIDPRAEFCTKCGARNWVETGSGRNRTTAALFALLLGGLGVHKFYLGQPGLGVLYLLLCWTFVPAIVAFVEGIVYLTMSDEAFRAKYH
jgi:TM2 domain-containing membrane protein YozV